MQIVGASPQLLAATFTYFGTLCGLSGNLPLPKFNSCISL